MRSRSSGVSWSGRLYAFDTVVRDTPSSLAIVISVTRGRPASDIVADASAPSCRAYGAPVRTVGLSLAVTGLAVAAVAMVAAATTPRAAPGPASRLAVWAGIATVAGAIVETTAAADAAAVAWPTALTDGHAAGAVLRLIGGALVVAGLFAEPVDAVAGGRWRPSGTAAIAVAGVVVGLVALLVG